MTPARVWLSVLGIGLLSTSVLIGEVQAPNAPRAPDAPSAPVFRVGVDAVRIDAVVTDKDGRPVADLKADDFELRQDGSLQSITLAEFVSERPTATTVTGPVTSSLDGSPRAPTAAGGVQRLIPIVVDDLGLSWESILGTRKALHKFIDERLQPTDLVGILRTSTFSGGLQQFTTDRQQLHAVVEQVRFTALSRRGVEPFEPTRRSTGNAEMDSLSSETVGLHGTASKEVVSALTTLSALTMIVRSAEDLPGRKVVVLLSEGFSLKTENGFTDPRILTALDRLYDRATRAGVVVYTLDVRQLQSGRPQAQDASPAADRLGQLLDTQDSLWVIAHETGGQAIENTNDLARGLERIDNNERGYYTLGYVPSHDTFAEKGKTARFHKIAVRVKRPGLRVRTRSGFLGVADQARSAVRTPAEQIYLAAMSPFVTTTVPLRATALSAYSKADGNFIRALLRIDTKTLTPQPADDGRMSVSADVLSLVFDEWGLLVSQRADVLTAALDESHPSDAARAVAYSVKVPVPRAGNYQVRFAIRDRASGALGSAGQCVEVPDAAHGRVALSDVLLAEDRPAGSKADQTAGAPVADPTIRIFKPGARLVYTYEIYNASGTLMVTPSVWHDGVQVFQAPSDRLEARKGASDEPLRVGGGLGLSPGLAPGDYFLQLEVKGTGRSGRDGPLVRRTDFEVR